VAVGDAEVWSLLEARDSSLRVPRVQVRELLTRTYQQMDQAIADMERGMSFADAVRKWSIDPAARATGGLTPRLPVTSLPAFGDVALRMKPGERYGPVSTPRGILMFERERGDTGTSVGDTAIAGRFARARREILDAKSRRAVTLRVAHLAGERGVDVYEDRLRQLEVSRVPMLAFRILGFGGRMLAVPFVVPELDWLSVQQEDRRVQP